MSGAEAVEYGLIDTVLERRADAPEDRVRARQAV